MLLLTSRARTPCAVGRARGRCEMEPNLSRSGTAARQQVWGAAKSRQWGAERGRRAGTLKAGCLNRVAIEQQLFFQQLRSGGVGTPINWETIPR